VALFLAGALYVRFAPTGQAIKQVPSHFNTPEKLKIVWSQPLRSQANAIRFSPDNRFLLVAGGTGIGSLSRYANGEYLYDFNWKDQRLQLWDVKHKRQLDSLKAVPLFGGWNGSHMFLMPDCKTLITAGRLVNAASMDVHKRRPDKTIPTEGAVTSIDISPDGKILALGTMSGVQLHDAKTYQLLKFYKHYGGNFGAEVRFGLNSRIVKAAWERSKVLRLHLQLKNTT
jgi:WD40 repeat protein